MFAKNISRINACSSTLKKHTRVRRDKWQRERDVGKKANNDDLCQRTSHFRTAEQKPYSSRVEKNAVGEQHVQSKTDQAAHATA